METCYRLSLEAHFRLVTFIRGWTAMGAPQGF